MRVRNRDEPQDAVRGGQTGYCKPTGAKPMPTRALTRSRTSSQSPTSQAMPTAIAESPHESDPVPAAPRSSLGRREAAGREIASDTQGRLAARPSTTASLRRPASSGHPADDRDGSEPQCEPSDQTTYAIAKAPSGSPESGLRIQRWHAACGGDPRPTPCGRGTDAVNDDGSPASARSSASVRSFQPSFRAASRTERRSSIRSCSYAGTSATH